MSKLKYCTLKKLEAIRDNNYYSTTSRTQHSVLEIERLIEEKLVKQNILASQSEYKGEAYAGPRLRLRSQAKRILSGKIPTVCL